MWILLLLLGPDVKALASEDWTRREAATARLGIAWPCSMGPILLYLDHSDPEAIRRAGGVSQGREKALWDAGRAAAFVYLGTGEDRLAFTDPHLAGCVMQLFAYDYELYVVNYGVDGTNRVIATQVFIESYRLRKQHRCMESVP